MFTGHTQMNTLDDDTDVTNNDEKRARNRKRVTQHRHIPCQKETSIAGRRRRRRGGGRGENREKTVKRGVNERQRWRKPEVTGGHGLKMIHLDQSDVHHIVVFIWLLGTVSHRVWFCAPL